MPRIHQSRVHLIHGTTGVTCAAKTPDRRLGLRTWGICCMPLCVPPADPCLHWHWLAGGGHGPVPGPGNRRREVTCVPAEPSLLSLSGALVSLPLISVFVYLGLIVTAGQAYGLLLLLAAARILPDLALDRATHRRKRDLLEGTPSTESFSEIGDHDLCKVTGYVHQTRTRYRLWGETVCNVWLVDRLAGKLFLPSVSEIRGVTEPLDEGTRLMAVGPSTRGFGITALQPVACAVVPSGWDQGIAEWFDVLWSRSWRRRLLRSTANSALYLIAVVFLSWAISGIGGERPAMLAISLLSGLFLSAYSHKTLRESANYDVSGYLEPRWRTLPGEAKERRLQHLRRLAQSGRVAEEYVHLVETAGDRL